MANYYTALYKSYKHRKLQEVSFKTRACTIEGILRAATRAAISKCGRDFHAVLDISGEDDFHVSGILLEIDSHNYGMDQLVKAAQKNNPRSIDEIVSEVIAHVSDTISKED